MKMPLSKEVENMRKFVAGMIGVLLVLATLNYQPVRAADLYVDAVHGTNNATCGTAPKASACKTLTFTVNNRASSGDTIYVAAGTYNVKLGEVFPITINKNLTLQGEGVDAELVTFIDAEHSISAARVIYVGNVTRRIIVNISGFTIMAGRTGLYYYNSSGKITSNIIKANYGAGIVNFLSDPIITDNEIKKNESYGIYNSSSNPTIKHNAISENSNDGIRNYDSTLTIINNSIIANSGGISNNVSGGTITSNYIEMNKNYGIYNSYSSPVITNNVIAMNVKDGIQNYGSSPTITNNTIDLNNNGIINFALASTESGNSIPSSPSITNNIITWNHNKGIYNDYSSNPICTYNDIWGHSDNSFGNPGTGSISADALFVDRSKGDYHLQVGPPEFLEYSPALNAGNNRAPSIPEFDIEGGPRIDLSCGRVDMGAYEMKINCASFKWSWHYTPKLLVWIPSSGKDDMMKQAESLLAEAKSKNLNTANCEILINEAKELLAKAKKVSANPIYANNLALQAIVKLKQAIECLKTLLG